MKVDMSSEAVTIRLKRVSQLRRLCLELGKMKPVVSIETPDADDEVSGKQPAYQSRYFSQQKASHILNRRLRE
jgi:hypothetical protein